MFLLLVQVLNLNPHIKRTALFLGTEHPSFVTPSDKEMIEVYDAKTGRMEKLQHVWVQTDVSKKKEHILDSKRSAIVQEQAQEANAKSVLAAKQRALSFFTMSADDNHFKVS